jgi:hypothetical protein
MPRSVDSGSPARCPKAAAPIDIVNPATGDLLTALPDANRATIITS